MAQLFYVFTTEQTAIAAELYIRQIGQLPLVGVNAKTGQLCPDKQKTIKWADPMQRLDGKFVFPRVPQANLDATPQAVKDQFSVDYPHVIEEYNPAWFPEQNED